MIHVVTAGNAGLYAAELTRLEQSWGLGAPEADEVQLLSLDDAGAPEFACRLRPLSMEGPGSALTPPLLDQGALGPGTWEIVAEHMFPQLRSPDPAVLNHRLRLRLAILEETRDRGGERLFLKVQIHQLAASLRAGWRMRLLGLPEATASGAVVPAAIDCSEAAIDDFRERLGRAPHERLHLTHGGQTWAAGPKEVEAFLDAARRLTPAQAEVLLQVLRAAASEEGEG